MAESPNAPLRHNQGKNSYDTVGLKFFFDPSLVFSLPLNKKGLLSLYAIMITSFGMLYDCNKGCGVSLYTWQKMSCGKYINGGKAFVEIASKNYNNLLRYGKVHM